MDACNAHVLLILQVPADQRRAHNARPDAEEDQVLTGNAQQMIDLASDLDLDSVRVGLTRFLLYQATDGQRTGTQWTVSEIAAHLGAGASAIRRSLHSLDREGLIRLERGRLVVTDVARLGTIGNARNPVDQRIAPSRIDGFG